MKLPNVERFMSQGIVMRKLVQRGFLRDVYDIKTVYDLDEAIELEGNGWGFDDPRYIFDNMILHLWRDIKQIEIKKQTHDGTQM